MTGNFSDFLLLSKKNSSDTFTHNLLYNKLISADKIFAYVRPIWGKWLCSSPLPSIIKSFSKTDTFNCSTKGCLLNLLLEKFGNSLVKIVKYLIKKTIYKSPNSPIIGEALLYINENHNCIQSIIRGIGASNTMITTGLMSLVVMGGFVA